MKLIDKEKVIEYILKRKSEIYDEYGGIVTTQRGLVEYKVLQEMQSFLNTLEVKDVDLERAIDRWICDAAITHEDCSIDDVIRTAKHFFELGLNARKGE